jgi:C-terminal processing protease CtpA/Prc
VTSERSIARAQRGTRLRDRAAPSALSIAERTQIIDTFSQLIEGLYGHLPLKRSMYAIDPIQRLRLLRQRVATIDDDELHAELSDTLTALRDAHTRYIGPTALTDHVATLPFLVEAYGEPANRRYIVSKIALEARRIHDSHFVPGVELLRWNAVPMDRAVDVHAERETGGRPDSRRSRALESFTFRALQYGPPPDEDWVIVEYRDLRGKRREVRFDWHVVKPGKAPTAGRTDRSRRAFAIDHAAETTRRGKKLLFAPELWYADQRPRARRRRAEPPVVGEWIDTDFQDVVAAKIVKTRTGTFGYLRLWSFDVADDVEFIDEITRLLSMLPARGLILDLRANPGGLVWAAERMLQLFTPHEVVTTRFSMLATPLTRAMADARQNREELDPWRESLNVAVSTGDEYSRAAPLTPTDGANDLGQLYGGPVVCVVDANTYSSGDLFAAGFYDNDIGTLVCVDAATGAGGANVWEPEDVGFALENTSYAQKTLPGGVSYTLAVRRATRAGAAEGVAIEDVGISGHEMYTMTKRDLTEDNVGLLNFCGALLRAQAYTNMTVTRDEDEPARLTVVTIGLDRLDVVVDGRPRESRNVADRATTIVDVDGPWERVDLSGYADDELRQRRRVLA